MMVRSFFFLLMGMVFLSGVVAAQKADGILNGGSAQGQVAQVPGISCKDCKYIKTNALGFWRMTLYPESVTPWSQHLKVAMEYSIDKPTVIRGVNAAGGETLYPLSDFKTQLDNISITLEVESELTTPGGGPKESYTSRIELSGYGNGSRTFELVTFQPGPALDSLYKLHARRKGVNYVREFVSRFNFNVVSIKVLNGRASGYPNIDMELGRRIEEGKKNIEFNKLVADGDNARAFDRVDEAIAKYTAALKIKNDPEVRAKLEELQRQKTAAASASSTEGSATGEQTANEGQSMTGGNSSGSDVGSGSGYSSSASSSVNQAGASTDGRNYNSSTSSGGGTNTGYGQGTLNSGTQSYDYDPQAWAKFNADQARLKQSMNDWNRQIEIGEQNRKMKAQYYDQVATNVATNIVNLANQIDAQQEQKRINKRSREIKEAVSDAFNSAYDEIDYWMDFQQKLISFANKYKTTIPKRAVERVTNATKSIQSSLEDLNDQLDEMIQDEQYDWERVQDENDIFKFPLGSWRQRRVGLASPVIGYDLAQIMEAGYTIPDQQTRGSYVNEAASLLAEFAVEMQNYEYAARDIAQFRANGGTNSRFLGVAGSAVAIKRYVQLKDSIQRAFNQFETDLKTNKGLIKIKSTDPYISLVDITPLVKGQKIQSKVDRQVQQIFSGTKNSGQGEDTKPFFPGGVVLQQAYAGLKADMGEFAPVYSRYNPDKFVDLKTDGYYVDPGTVSLSLYKSYMEPSPMVVTLQLSAGESKTIDLGDYSSRFEPNRYFKPFDELDHKRRRFTRKNKFALAYSLYNMGISEVSLTLWGNQRYSNLKSYQQKRNAFFTNVDLGRVFYGASQITNGFQNEAGDAYDKHTLDFTYIGGELGLFGLGYAKGLFGGGGMLEIQAAASAFSYYSFTTNATRAIRLGSMDESVSGKYTLDIAHYAVLHGIVGVSIPVSKAAFNLRYRYNFYPLVELQQEVGENGDISEFEDDYAETYTPFFEDMFNNYFTHNITVSFTF